MDLCDWSLIGPSQSTVSAIPQVGFLLMLWPSLALLGKKEVTSCIATGLLSPLQRLALAAAPPSSPYWSSERGRRSTPKNMRLKSNLQIRFQSAEIFYLSNYNFCTQLIRTTAPLRRPVSGKEASNYIPKWQDYRCLILRTVRCLRSDCLTSLDDWSRILGAFGAPSKS